MRLGRKEFVILCLVGVFVFGLFYYLFLISPGLSRQQALQGQIHKKEADLIKMAELKAKWDEIKGKQVEAERALSQRGDKFTLLSFLEGVSREVGIANKINYMKPLSFPEEPGTLRQAGMEIRIEEMNIGELVEYLHRIEYSGKLIRVRRIRIERAAKGEETAHLKVTLQVGTYLLGTQSG